MTLTAQSTPAFSSTFGARPTLGVRSVHVTGVPKIYIVGLVLINTIVNIIMSQNNSNIKSVH